jgi:hypothetical protein
MDLFTKDLINKKYEGINKSIIMQFIIININHTNNFIKRIKFNIIKYIRYHKNLLKISFL